MSYTDDTRVVDLQFNNKQFEANVSQTLNSLDKLDNALQFKGAEKGFKDIEKAANKLDMSGLEKAVNNIEARFTSIGDTFKYKVIDRIQNEILNFGSRTMKMFTTDSVKDGWNKYGQQVGAVQTILNSTGESMEVVEKELEKLSWYTDETSYYFSDMINNISRFTAQGIKISDATNQMIGIANAAGLAGVNAENAGHAMTGFANAIGKGYMDRMSWQWIQTAKMETPALKQMFIDVGVELGRLEKRGNEVFVKGTKDLVTTTNFVENLKDKWLDNEVLNKALDNYGAYTVKLKQIIDSLDDLSDTGWTTASVMEALTENSDTYGKMLSDLTENTYSEKDALDAINSGGQKYKDLLDTISEKTGDVNIATAVLEKNWSNLGEAGMKAAQETKTFGDMVGAFQEVVSSGWRQTFDIVIGNYEEAKELWSGLVEDLWDVFAVPAEARNSLLQEWKDFGGRDDLIQSVRNLFYAITSVVEPIKDAFHDIFPPKTAAAIADITYNFKNLTEQLILSDEAAGGLKSTFKLLFSVIKPFVTIAKKGVVFGTKLVLVFVKITQAVLESAGGIDKISESIFKFIDNSRLFRIAISGIVAGMLLIKAPAIAITTALAALFGAFYAFGGVDYVKTRFGQLSAFLQNSVIPAIKNVHSKIVEIVPWMESWSSVIEHLGSIAEKAFFKVGSVVQIIASFIGNVWSNHIKNIRSIKDVFLFIGTGIQNVFDKLKNSEKIQKIFDIIKIGMESAKEALEKLMETVNIFNSDFSTGQAGIVIFSLAILVLIYNVNKLIIKLTSMASALTTTKDIFTSINKYINALASASKYSALIQIGIGLGIISASLIALSYANWDHIWEAVAILGAFTAAGLVFVAITSKMNKAKDTVSDFLGSISGSASGISNAVSQSASITAMATSIFLISAAFAKLAVVLKDMSFTNIIGVLLVLSTMIIGITEAAEFMSKHVGKIEVGSMAMLSFAASIYVMAAAMKTISNIPDLGSAWAAIASMGVVFGGLIILMGTFKTGAGAGLMLGVLALKLYVSVIDEMIITISKWGLIDTSAIFKSLRILLIGFIGIGATLGMAGRALLVAGSGMLAAVLALKIVFDTFGSISPNSQAYKNAMAAFTDMAAIVQKIIMIVGIFQVLVAFLNRSKIDNSSRIFQIFNPDGKKRGGLFGVLLGLSLFALTLSSVVKTMSTIDSEKLKQIGSIIFWLGIVFAAILGVSKLAEKSAPSIRALTTTVSILSGLMMLMSLFTKKDSTSFFSSQLWEPMIILSIAMVTFGKSMQLAGSYADKIKTESIILMCSAALIAGGYLITMAAMHPRWRDMIIATAALSVSLISIGKGLAMASKDASNVTWRDVVMLASMGSIIAGYLVTMSAIGSNWNDIISASVGLGIAIISMGTAMRIASKATSSIDGGTLVAMIGIAIAVAGGLASIAYSSGGNWKASIAAASAFGIAVLSIAGSMAIASKASNPANIVSILTMIGVAVAIGASLAAIAYLGGGDWNRTLAAATAFGIAILSLAGSMAIASNICNPIGWVSIGMMAAMAGVVGIALAALSALDANSVISAAEAIAITATSLSLIAVALGAFAEFAIPGSAALALVGVGAIAFGTAIGIAANGLSTLVATIGTFMVVIVAMKDQLIPTFTAIGEGIGTMVQEIINRSLIGVGEGIVNMLAILAWGASQVIPTIKAGFLYGFDQAIANLKAEGAALANGFFDGFEDAAEIHSPSRRAMREGIYIDAGVAQGVEAGRDRVSAYAKRMAGTVTDAVHNEAPKTSEETEDLMDGVGDAISDKTPEVANAAERSANTIFGKIKGIFNFITGKSTMSGFLDGMKSAFGDTEIGSVAVNAISDVFGSKNLWEDASKKKKTLENGEWKYWISDNGTDWEEIYFDEESQKWKKRKNALTKIKDEVGDALGLNNFEDILPSGGGGGGSSLSRGLDDSAESAEQAAAEFEYYNDVMNYASGTVRTFKDSVSETDDTLSDVDAEKLAISKTQELVMAHSDLIGTLDAEGNAITSWSQLTQDQVREAGAAWEEYQESIKEQYTNTFDFFQNPYESINQNGLTTFAAEYEKALSSSMGALDMAEALESLSTKLYDPLFQKLADSMDLGQILAYASFSDEELAKLNQAYLKYEDAIEKASNLHGIAAERARKNSADIIEASLNEMANIKVPDSVMEPARENMTKIFEQLMDSETISDLLSKSVSSGVGTWMGEAFIQNKEAFDAGDLSIADIAAAGIKKYYEDQAQNLQNGINEAFSNSGMTAEDWKNTGEKAAAIADSVDKLNKGVQFINEAGKIGEAVDLDESIQILEDSNWDLNSVMHLLADRILDNTNALNNSANRSIPNRKDSNKSDNGTTTNNYNITVPQTINTDSIKSEADIDRMQHSAFDKVSSVMLNNKNVYIYS